MIRALGDRVFARPLQRAEQTAGGILLPDSAQERPQIAEILACGPAAVATGLRPGSHVVFPKYHARYVTWLDGEQVLDLRLDELLAETKGAF